MPSEQVRPQPAPLGYRLAAGAGAEQIADEAVAVWSEVVNALHPVIGHRGVAALYHRSLALTTPQAPWLQVGKPMAMAAVDLPTLRAVLAQQTAADAAAGGDALFQSFQSLLASLIGEALTSQLLSGAWARTSGALPAQDTAS